MRTDKYDKVYYVVRDPTGRVIAGDQESRCRRRVCGPRGHLTYDATRGPPAAGGALIVPCGDGGLLGNRGGDHDQARHLARDILIGSVLPQGLLAVLTLALVWFGVTRGLAPLARLSDEILERSPRDLSAINERGAPEEAQPLVAALNKLFDQVGESNRNQQRFLATPRTSCARRWRACRRTPKRARRKRDPAGARHAAVPNSSKSQRAARPSALRGLPTSCWRLRGRSPGGNQSSRNSRWTCGG